MVKKKIGIITLVHVRNIGAVLQAYAMREKLTALGCEVHFIKGYDFKSSLVFLKGDMGRIRPWNIKFLIDKNQKFKQAFKKFTEKKLSEIDLSQYDAVILGSDSIWIPKNGNMQMDDTFFGNVECKLLSSYAASSGGNEDLSLYSANQIESLKNLDIITVRDIYAQKLVREATGREASIVLDPTLLIDWEPVISKETTGKVPIREPYLLVYGGVSKAVADEIKNFAEKKQLKVVNIGTYNRHFHTNVAVSPFEYLLYIKYASYIVTSMFHGVMLSLSMHKRFRYISMDPNRDRKISTGMEMLGLGRDDIWKWKYGQEKLNWDLEIDYKDFEIKRAELTACSEDLIRQMAGE